jgi:hypothetical protein
MDIFEDAPSFKTGLENAIEHYKVIKYEDRENFILIQFIEDFYGRYSLFDKYHTKEKHENDFKFAVYLAFLASDNQNLFRDIYNIFK